MLQHRQYFPAIGDIKIHCLKVKHRGIYHHLSDFMLVKSTFGDSKKNQFLLVDASHLEQFDEGPSKLSLIHGSSSKHPKIFVPIVNQKLPSVDHFTSDGSCKKASKNVKGARSSNLEPSLEQHLDPKVTEKLYTVDKEIKYKKRIREVHNDDASVMKKHKTQRKEGDAKAL
ncbi:unnamed protein product [Lactuca saligna]|uniref:Uncharacterized protein n=1 Tax=Lactuca saligna TaxID=75948 RepID=A0AA35ZJM9_LACSI|nr:unnamed protein product [Lactuca saligna]